MEYRNSKDAFHHFHHQARFTTPLLWFFFTSSMTLISAILLFAFCPGEATKCTTEQPCADASCCSQYGFCGNTTAFCGTGCLGLCQDQGNKSNSRTSDMSPNSTVYVLVNDEVYDQFLYRSQQPNCPGYGFYNRSSFLAAAATFPDFGTTGGLELSMRELAAFFSYSSQVTEGGCYVEATDQTSADCSDSSEWKCAPGKMYYGRGPLQIAWNENYGPMGVALGFDGINSPEVVATDPVLSFKGSLWFWMTQPAEMYSCHQAILLESQGFSKVASILNGGPLDPVSLQQRTQAYNTFYSILSSIDSSTSVLVTPSSISSSASLPGTSVISEEERCIGSLCGSSKIFLGLMMPLLAGGVLFLVFVFISLWKLRPAWHEGNLVKVEELRGLAGTPINFSYATLASATKNFTNFLGEGGFGLVYKGVLSNGDTVAVKVLKESLHSDQQFLREIETLGRLHHINLVRLVGFCMQNTKKILVYEFISNSSLDKHLFDLPASSHCVDLVLDWTDRYEIALGLARGLSYLHEDCLHKIIHRDLKPHNILLDEMFCPKISDFGLAKIMQRDQSKVLSYMKGTPGYVAPEFWQNRMGNLSTKFDVFSFGMVALELVAGRPNFKFDVPSEEAYFPSWAFTNVGSPAKVLDQRIVNPSNLQQVQDLLLVALWCIQEDPLQRPSMSRVVQYLEGSVEVPKNPPKPFKYLEDDSTYSASLCRHDCQISSSTH